MSATGYFSIFGNLDWVMDEVVRRLPPYRRSVETCCGRGELMWHTQSPEEEILNDIDPNIIRIHSFAKNVTYDELEKLNDYDWLMKKETFNFVRDKFEVKSELDFTYRFLYLLGGTTTGSNFKSCYFFRMRDGNTLNPTNRIKEIKPRLQNTKITQMDALDCIRKYDSPDTLLFLDPPYPSRERYYGKATLDWNKLYELLKTVQSKWMMVFDPHVVPDYKGISKKSLPYVKECEKVAKKFIEEYPHISLRQPLSYAQQFKTWKFLREYKEYFIVCNYPIPKLEEYETKELEW